MPRRRRRRRFHFLIGACAGACIALAAIVGAWALGLGPFAPVIGVPDAFADRITVGEDGGFTYLFPEEDIAYDADEHALYADDTLIAYLEPGVGARERLALADRVGGTVVGNLEGGIDLVQIHVGDASFADLTAMAEELSSSEGVIMALVEGPLLRQADAGADPNGWGDGGSIEDDPSGNNWWAEAIGAYRAWEHADRFSPVAVGVIDDGFDLDHPDLDGAATLLSSYSGNGASDHGTAVASIIGALDNGEGLRGDRLPHARRAPGGPGRDGARFPVRAVRRQRPRRRGAARPPQGGLRGLRGRVRPLRRHLRGGAHGDGLCGPAVVARPLAHGGGGALAARPQR